MGKKLPPKQMELYRRVDEILFYKWDLIGISDTDCPRDEYHMYLPLVFKHALNDRAPDSLTEYLTSVTTEGMGMSANKEHDKAIAKLIFSVKEHCMQVDD